jgi:hypothetical protein
MRRWWYSASASRKIAAGIVALLIAVPLFPALAWARLTALGVALRPRGVDVSP